MVKAISWRIWATTTTALVAFVATGDWRLSLSIGGLEAVAKIGLFVAHERIWTRIQTREVKHVDHVAH